MNYCLAGDLVVDFGSDSRSFSGPGRLGAGFVRVIFN
jgi:hypothetical protein